MGVSVETGAAVRLGFDRYEAARAITYVVVLIVLAEVQPWTYGIGWATTGSVVLAVSAFGAACGSRAAGWATIVVGLAVLSVPQWDGNVSHYHHVLWFAVVIEVGRNGPWQRCLWALVAFVYLIPGAFKLLHAEELVDGGMASIFDQVRAKYEWHNPIPTWGWAPGVAAVAVIVFELAAPVLLFTRWRRHALVVALVFHLSTWWTLGISFSCLWLLFPILWWEPTDEGNDPLPVVVTAAVIVLSLLAGEEAWPFAHYPHFV